MNQSRASLLRSVLLSTAAVLAAVTAVAPRARAQSLAAESYDLPNGMTVILREDHSLPRVAINLLYKVGSRDDPQGKSGFAHLFEHLMFMGTERAPGNQFDTIMESVGGANNAFTADDFTDYFSVGPSHLLPTLLWLDADRLEDLARTMDQAKLDRQREVVLNERRRNYEDAPYGRVYLVLPGLLFPAAHPYQRPGIGSPADLGAATLSDVRDFFADFYTPTNVSLAVVGDFDSAEVKPLIARWFGTLAAGRTPARATPTPVAVADTVRSTIFDRVDQPAVVVAWPSAERGTQADAELDLAAAVLGNGKSSRLYQRLVVKDALATDVSVDQQSEQLASTFLVFVTAKPDADLGRIESVVDEEIGRLTTGGPTAEELRREQAQHERSVLASLQSVEGVAQRLNEYEVFFHRPDALAVDLGRYRSATEESVRLSAKSALGSGRVVLRVLPVAPQRADSPRAERPAIGKEPAFAPPSPETFKLANGIRVELWHRSTLPLVAITARLAGEPVAPAQAGVAGLAAEMLTEGAAGKDAGQFAAALAGVGATLETHAGTAGIVADLFVPKRGLGEATALLADALRRPNLRAEDFARVHALALDNLHQAEDDNSDIAARVARRVYFGEGDPYALGADGSIATVTNLKLDDVRARLATDARPERAELYVAGDVTVDEARALLERGFGDWKVAAAATAGSQTTPVPNSSQAQGLRLVVVDRSESAQTAVRLILPGLSAGDPRRVSYRLLSTVLGGTFTSRLNLNLREQHGYAYGARAYSLLEQRGGVQIASTEVQTDKTGAALSEILKEYGRIQTGDIAADEVKKAESAMHSSAVSAVADLKRLTGTAAQLADRGLAYSTLAADLDAARALQAADLNRVAPAATKLDGAVLVLVGDTAKFLPQLEGLHLPRPESRDAEGAPLPPRP